MVIGAPNHVYPACGHDVLSLIGMAEILQGAPPWRPFPATASAGRDRGMMAGLQSVTTGKLDAATVSEGWRSTVPNAMRYFRVLPIWSV